MVGAGGAFTLLLNHEIVADRVMSLYYCIAELG